MIAPESCTVCHAEGVVLFEFPAAWDGGLCQGCAEHLHAAAFREHFGEVHFVTDGDAGKGQAKM